MSSTYTGRKRLERQTAGENNNTWGGFLNTNTIDLIDESFGLVCVTMTTAGDSTLSTQNGSTDEGRRSQIYLTGTPTSNVRLFVPAAQSFYLVRNKMGGAKKVTLTNTGGTNGVDFSGSASGAEQGIVVSDGTNVREVARTVSIGGFTAFTSAVIAVVSDAPTDTTGGAIADFMPFLDASDSGALNKVLVTDFFKNVLANVSARTSVSPSDRLMVTDTDGANIAGIATVQKLHDAAFGLTAKTTLTANDTIPLNDSAASNVGKKITYTNAKTQLITDMAAVQATQETGSSTTLFVTPGVQHFHPSAAKSWTLTTYSGGTPTNSASYNITSITDTASGRLTITIATDHSSTNYSYSCASEESSLGSELFTNIENSTRAAGSITVACAAIGGGYNDGQSISFQSYGDL